MGKKNGAYKWEVCAIVILGSFLLAASVSPAQEGLPGKDANLLPVYSLLLLTGSKYTKGVLVKDIWEGTESSEPDEFAVINGTLYFNAMDADHGGEVWTSDGTAGGTTLLKDIRIGSESSNGFVAMGNVVFDRGFILFNGYAYFAATDINDYGRLWRSDGTTAGTVEYSGPKGPGGFTVFNDELYFSGSDGSSNWELWKTDGISPATLVKDISATDSSSPNAGNPLTEYNNELYFSAVNISPEVCGLWKTNGTDVGTVAVKPGTAIDAESRQIVYNNKLYFPANSGELWVTDGTPGGTQMLKVINSGGSANIFSFTLFDNKLFFKADDGINGQELWVTDGTPGGTMMLKDINTNNSGADSSYPQHLIVFDNMLYFRADDGVHGYELWKSDGTPAGTVMALDIKSGPDGSDPQELTIFNGSLYFNADDGVHGAELWKVDGTSGEVVFAVDIIPGAEESYPYYLTVFNNSLYFQAGDSEHGWELWMLK